MLFRSNKRSIHFILLICTLTPNLGASFGPYIRLLSTSCAQQQHPSSSLNKNLLLSMGMKVNIRIVGRKSGSEAWLEDACDMYLTRLRPSGVEVETTWHKDNPALIKGVETDASKGNTIVLLDPLGKTKTSEQFSEDLYEWLDRGGSRMSFVIGGAEGLPSELKYPAGTTSGQKMKPSMLISLSSMTFTHQFARLLLIEQIYRGTEIRKGSGYHK
ncbi:unnamed protein product [Cylindrotheca closterium]|uniref:Ribosomal RNA large subunit methyltransferase H n=1 Tax=Cylindrotheca closterium TaxID=2856 RepID=A0AAD2CC20_9STRA|nr:unnamed protein product [Cylindrotheca closterium]